MEHTKRRALIAWLVVCVVWGSTYLFIRIGVEHLPPFLFAGVRFLLSGAILGAFALRHAASRPQTAAEWRTLALTGTLFFAGGNGLVVWAEQYVSSGAASVYVVTVAIWAAVFDAVIPGGTSRFTTRVVVGLLAGLLGSLLLVGISPSELLAADLRGPVALTIASASWAFGTVLSKRRPVKASPWASAAIQMLSGGAVLAVLGLALGEAPRWTSTAAGYGALAYLIVFGAIIGFSAYVYALRHMSATAVGTYAYVNPVVAVLLGWLVLKEPISGRMLVAMALMLGGVLLIQGTKGAKVTGATAKEATTGTESEPIGTSAVHPSSVAPIASTPHRPRAA